MSDISSLSRTSADIFRGIMDWGPLTLYSATAKTKIPIGTIHRHFRILEKAGKIRPYLQSKKGRKKIEYGPTIYGILDLYRKDKKFAEKIENYFLIWIENNEFQKELEKEGFDTSISNLKKSKQIFQKYMNYFAAVEEQIEAIKKGEDAISRETLIMLSSGILSANPQYQKLWMELYSNLPGMRKSLDEHMENITRAYREFKKNIKN
jgi:hypothetical protein